MKVTGKRLTELLPYFQEVAQAQEVFWDALGELERELANDAEVDIDSSTDLTALTNRKNVKAWLNETETTND